MQIRKLSLVLLLLWFLAACGDFQWFPDANPNVDTTPDQFSFVNKCTVTTKEDAVSGPVTIKGINAPTGISIVGGEYAIDNGTTFTANAGSISNNQTVTVRPPGGTLPTGLVVITLTVGGVSATYKVDIGGTSACLQGS